MALPVITLFVVVPNTISSGSCVVLVWETTGADTVSFNQGIGEVALSGQLSVYPTENKMYVITATNGDGNIVATRNVTVVGGLISARRMPLDFNVSTFGGASRLYNGAAGIQDWSTATAVDLKTNKKGEVLLCFPDADANLNQSFSVALTDSKIDNDYFRNIIPVPGSECKGLKSNGFYLNRTTSTSICIEINEKNFGLYDMGMTMNFSNAAQIPVVQVQAGRTGVKIVGCYIFDCVNSHATGIFHGFYNRAIGTVIVDCMATGIDGAGFLAQVGGTSIGIAYWYNCTGAGNGWGFYNASAGDYLIAKNCVSEDNVTSQWQGGWTKGVDSTNDSGVTFISVPSNYHLSLADTVAIGIGTDLSADVVFPFNDDIDRDMIIAPWDSGADFRIHTDGSLFAFMDAALQKSRTLSISLDAATQKTGVSISSNTDAALAFTASVFVLIDSGLQQSIVISSVTDAALQSVESLSVGVDAALGITVSLVSYINAALMRQDNTVLTNVDAAIQSMASLFMSLDSALKSNVVLSSSIDAAIQSTDILSTFVNSALQMNDITTTFQCDAKLVAFIGMGSLLLDAAVWSHRFAIDAESCKYVSKPNRTVTIDKEKCRVVVKPNKTVYIDGHEAMYPSKEGSTSKLKER